MDPAVVAAAFVDAVGAGFTVSVQLFAIAFGIRILLSLLP